MVLSIGNVVTKLTHADKQKHYDMFTDEIHRNYKHEFICKLIFKN